MFSKQFPGHGSFTGRIVSIEVVDDEKVFKVAYDDSDSEEKLGEGEITGLLDVFGDKLHQSVIDAIFPAFYYLENRLTGQCQAQFDCTHSCAICRVLRLFSPSYVAEHEATTDSAPVRELALVVPLAMERGGGCWRVLNGTSLCSLPRRMGSLLTMAASTTSPRLLLGGTKPAVARLVLGPRRL